MLLPLFLKNKGETLLHGYEEQARASVNVKYWLMVLGCIGTNDDLLGLRTDLSLKSREYYTCATTYHSQVSKGPALPGLTGVISFCAPQIPVQLVKKPPEKFHRVSLSFQSEFPAASSTNFLQEFVGADLTLK
jgi:hypothetical protein